AELCRALDLTGWFLCNRACPAFGIAELPAARARLRELLATDIELNTQGLVVWLQRRRKA
ncbi:MAG: hypothetical protein L0H83_09035, partial [Salinisphaera sp.]|nr:hypothetical protein [Salinisphaera sp.]